MQKIVQKIKNFQIQFGTTYLYQILFRMYPGLCKKNCGACRLKMHDFTDIVAKCHVFRNYGRHFEFLQPSCSFHKIGTALDIFLV